MAKKEKTIEQLIEDTEDLVAEVSDNLQKIKKKHKDQEEMDEFERCCP
jgi:hypothetical protein|tara:strand:+ start:39 stop:182 length:144 start_codon:yes stop_codon:yes gene_type:complete